MKRNKLLFIFYIITMLISVNKIHAQFGEGGGGYISEVVTIGYAPPPVYNPPPVIYVEPVIQTITPPSFTSYAGYPGSGGGGSSSSSSNSKKNNNKKKNTKCAAKKFGGTKASGKILAVFFKGNLNGKGKDISVKEARDTGKRYQDLEAIANSTGKDFRGEIIAPGLTSRSAVENAVDFINQNYSSGDQIVLYGFSWGADAAVDLADVLNHGNTPTPVNLLITVDGSDGPLGNETVNNRIPDNVGINLNIYQTTPSGPTVNVGPITPLPVLPVDANYDLFLHMSGHPANIPIPGSRGSVNSAINPSITTVFNQNVTSKNITHGNIQDDKRVKDILNKRLKINILGGGCP